MSDFYTIPEAPHLIRDKRSKALLSIDKSGLAASKAAKRTTDEIAALSNEINSVKDDIREIKTMLRELANGNTASSVRD